MKKLILYFLCLMCALSLWSGATKAHALAALEPEQPCSLQLDYSREGIPFPDLTVQIYRVAEAFSDGSFQLIAPFSGYPVNIHGITSQTEWQNVATTLRAYITANQVQPTCTATTNAEGLAVFEGLQTGLYLVFGVITEQETGLYQFRDFMIYLPTPIDGEGFQYDMQAKPKCSHFVPYTQYSLRKLWQDPGNETARPEQVLVDIYRDGVLQETVSLNADNNWCYSWRSEADGAVWTITEQSVPDHYHVVISQVENAFILTNTDPSVIDPPDTGDTFPFSLALVLLCVAGFALILLSTLRERKHP